MISGFEWNAASSSGVVSSLFRTFGFAPAFSSCLTCAASLLLAATSKGVDPLASLASTPSAAKHRRAEISPTTASRASTVSRFLTTLGLHQLPGAVAQLVLRRC